MTSRSDSTRSLLEVRRDLLSDDPATFNSALRHVLTACLDSGKLWFTETGQVAAIADREGQTAALAELVMILAFEGEYPPETACATV